MHIFMTIIALRGENDILELSQLTQGPRANSRQTVVQFASHATTSSNQPDVPSDSVTPITPVPLTTSVTILIKYMQLGEK